MGGIKGKISGTERVNRMSMGVKVNVRRVGRISLSKKCVAN